MKIGLVTTHAWPIPSPARTGDIYFLDLAIALQKAGHAVTMFSPQGTDFPFVRPMPCAFGTGRPSAAEAELKCLNDHTAELMSQDVVHDCSTSKLIGHSLRQAGRPVVCTLNGGPWRSAEPPPNLIVQTQSQRERVLRGATDYEGTRTPDTGGPLGYPVKECHVVNDGIDTDFYCPDDYSKDNYVLWLNRWHPAKGFDIAVEFAKRHPAHKLVMAGVNPADETSDYQRDIAIHAAKLSENVPNITFEWLPGENPYHNLRKRELLRRAKAFLYPTQIQEPFGLSQVEALACGTPVIATRYGSTAEILVDGKTGYLCTDDAGVHATIAAAVQWAGSVALPADCRIAAVSKFSRDIMAANYLVEYAKVIAGAQW